MITKKPDMAVNICLLLTIPCSNKNIAKYMSPHNTGTTERATSTENGSRITNTAKYSKNILFAKVPYIETRLRKNTKYNDIVTSITTGSAYTPNDMLKINGVANNNVLAEYVSFFTRQV